MACAYQENYSPVVSTQQANFAQNVGKRTFYGEIAQLRQETEVNAEDKFCLRGMTVCFQQNAWVARCQLLGIG